MIGEITNAGISAYLLIGIPLVAAFQLRIAERPIRELWIRDGRPIERPELTRNTAILLAIFPAYLLIHGLVNSQSAGFIFYALATIGGAGAAGYAFGLFEPTTRRYLLFCLATAGVIGIGLDAVAVVYSLTHPTGVHPSADVPLGITSLLTYLPAVFVMEEVAFRGCVDSHVHHEGDEHGLLTAIYVSVLWGIWHAPVIGWSHIVGLILYQGLVGTFLSIYWRKSGNLGVPGTTHAVIDSVRNAMGLMP